MAPSSLSLSSSSSPPPPASVPNETLQPPSSPAEAELGGSQSLIGSRGAPKEVLVPRRLKGLGRLGRVPLAEVFDFVRPLTIGPSTPPSPTPASTSASSTAAAAATTTTTTTSAASPSHDTTRGQQQLASAVYSPTPSMTLGSPLGMRNRLSSSSSPSLRNSPSGASTPRNSDSPAAPNGDNSGGNNGAVANSSTATVMAARDEEEDARSVASRRSSSTATAASRPSLLSRLSLPLQLRNRNRNVADFHINTHEPHKKYTAGEHVRGNVILVVVKPVRITHLTVALSGFVRVYKEPAVGSKLPPNIPTGGLDRPQYHGNGVATLFQDEQVLSGDGRLDAGRYEFGFDLVFPSKGLPSSIDFERGTISYMVSATLTRPTSIAATITCDRKVTLVERLDIGHVPTPRPRTIFLEPISKRSRNRRKSATLDKASSAAAAAATAAAAASSDVNDYTSEAGSVDPSVVTEDSGRDRAVDVRTFDQSDIRSEFSGESGRSVSTSGFSRAELAQVASAKQQVVDDKTITATVELVRGGCLPGDTVTVRVNVHHIKRVKSMNGVIVTLFRQGKIDSSPSSALFTDKMTKEERKRFEKQDVFPRSRTGLGGLSLSSSGSTSVFRKDLDQGTAPLITHPTTLSAAVTVSVKLPDDSFPTIRNVPGEMVSFKYQVEVIVDLGGRLSNKFQGGQSRVGQVNNSGFETNKNTYTSRSSIADTAPLRREKGVISVTMETIVGSSDSSRTRAARASQSSRALRITAQSDDDEAYHTEHSQPDDSHWGTPYVNGQSANHYFTQHHTANQRYYGPPSAPHPSQQSPTPGGPSQPYPYPANGDIHEATPEYIPPPEVIDERNMTDKERIRQAETRLLPSQPPAPGSGSGSGSSAAADNAGSSSSAPNAPDASFDDIPGDEYAQDEDETPRVDPARPALDIASPDEGPSAPPPADLEGSANAEPTQDKQEVERRRLMGEASAPPEVPEDMQRQQDAGPSRSATNQQEAEMEPSAPTLTEDDAYQGYDFGAGPSRPIYHHHNEQLPAYER